MIAAVENPDNVFFCEPKSKTLHAGILDKFVNPPARPVIKIIYNQLYCSYKSPVSHVFCQSKADHTYVKGNIILAKENV